MAPGGAITLSGQLVGQKDDSKSFTVLFNYRPVNFSSDFQTTESVSVTLDESIIDLDVNVPERVRSGETIEYTLEFTNEATLPLTNVKAFVDYPSGFSPTSATPSADQGDDTWVFEEIDPGDTEEIVVKGTFDATSGTEHEFKAQIGLQEPDGFFNVQTEADSTVKIVNPELSLQLSAPEFAQAGEELEYTIDVQNTSDAVIENVETELSFSGNALETDQISLSEIVELQPNESKSFTQTVNVLPQLPDNATEIIAALSVESARVDGATVQFEQTTETVTTLQSNVKLVAEARYYDDDLTQLGSGPLPPKVGSETQYVVRWTVSAAGGDIDTIEVQSTLPSNVNYVRSRGNTTVSHSSGTVKAELRNVKAGVSKVVEFVVGVTPVRDDINKLLILSNDAVLTAKDTASGSSLQVQAGQVTSKLSNDPGAESGDGTVVKKNQ